MNCETFNDRLPEYLEGALSATDRAAARDHLQTCGACQNALARQEVLAKSIRLSFHRDTHRLSLSPETKRNISNALRQPEIPPTVWERIQASFTVFRQHRAWAGTAIACLVLLIAGGGFYLTSARHPSTQAVVPDEHVTCVIDVPVQTEIRVFRRQNNVVVDAAVTEYSVIDASFSEKMRSSPASQ